MCSMDNLQSVSQYVTSVRQQFLSGHAREHAYRPALERLMSSFEDTTAVNDPKRSEHGNPDMAFIKKSHSAIILGYAEAKDIDVDLDKTLKTEQLRRYAGYANLLLTNYLDFRFLRNGEEYESIRVGHLTDGEVIFDEGQFERLRRELKNFLEQPPESIRSGKRLAEIMGGKARRIRDRLTFYLKNDEKQNSELEKIFKMMKELLVHDLTMDKFADMYAQTLVYGLFVARYNDKSPENFTRNEARDLVPASNPFLREFFDHIVGPRFDSRLANIVDELCAVFEVSNVHLIVQKHLHLFEIENDRDPIIHFYEDFLKEYDPAERKKMGAYYTPIPVVKFIVRNVDQVLKNDFLLANGLADTTRRPVTLTSQGTKTKTELHRVQILDPAVGTATFLNEIIKHIHKTFVGQEGRWPDYVTTDLLPRLHGFELMMAPYTIAHLKLGMTLQETGVEEFKQRLGVYLTNTLEEGRKDQVDLFTQFGLAEAVTAESNEASKIKRERPVMVVIGNPPYSVSSNNRSEYIQNLIKDYKKDLNERKINLDDDYIKFIRFAEDMISKNGEGIVAMITNNSYIDGITHRQMRKHLLETFDTIYILDLHGSSKKQEVTPDGGKDENVFHIQQGVAIIVAVKTSKKRSSQLGSLYHAQIFGTRSSKFDQLTKDPTWQVLEPKAPNYLFVPTNLDGHREYQNYIGLDELFMKYNSGIQTKRDKFVYAFSQDELNQRLADLTTLNHEDMRTKYSLPPDGRDWTIKDASEDIKQSERDLVKVLYHPFDERLTLYTGKTKGFMAYPRSPLMENMLRDNIALITVRNSRRSNVNNFFLSNTIIDKDAISPFDNARFFPLYLYHNDERTANLRQAGLKRLYANLKKTYEPADVLDYVYSVLYSQKYRDIYKEFIKADLPRIPVPQGDEQFQRLANLGRELRQLHMMTSPSLDSLITTFPKHGSGQIDQIQYVDRRVWINDDQYFGEVPEAAWNFNIGGYQPAQKWLKDRKGRTLTNQEIIHYQKIINILLKTNELMQEIDR